MIAVHLDVALGIINAAGMDETCGTYVDDECFDIHDYDDDTDHDTDVDANDDSDDNTYGGGRGNRRPLRGGAEFIS